MGKEGGVLWEEVWKHPKVVKLGNFSSPFSRWEPVIHKTELGLH